MNTGNQTIANAAAKDSCAPSCCSVQTTKMAAKEELCAAKEKAVEKGESFIEKVKDFTADKLESAAKGAGNIADKLRN